MVVFSRPSAGREIRNYTILDLEGEPLTVRERWARAILDYRSWCYYSTNERFEFGNMFRRSAMVPQSGQFFFYLKLANKWLCLVIDGPTSYLIGFITSTVGKDDELHILEMDRSCGTQYIQKSKAMGWNGRYFDAANTQVGYDAIVKAFHGMYGYVNGGILPNPREHNVGRWCDIFLIHFPEAGRFDSLLLCNIYNRFVDGGVVGHKPIKKVQNWSKDCKYVLERAIEKTLPEEKNRKWTVKRAGKSRKPKVPEEHTQSKCKIKTSSNNKGVKLLSSSEDENCNDELTDERILITLNDVRLFHRKKPVPAKVWLASMPIQLHKGQAINPPTDLEPSDADFLLCQFDNLSHTYCTYIDGKWVCKVPGSEKRSGRMIAPDASPSPELGMTSDVPTILNTNSRSGSTVKYSVKMKGQDSSPSMELGMTSKMKNILVTQLKSGSAEKCPVTNMGQDVYARMEIDKAHQVHVHEVELETLSTLRPEKQNHVAKDGIIKHHNCGLQNHGNTCYINSTLQCLSTVPELKSSLASFAADSGYTIVNQDSYDLTCAAHDVFLQLGESVGPVDPHHFLEILRKGKPEFSEQHDNVYKQQDAEECWSHLITKFEQAALGSESSGSAAASMKELFGIELLKRIPDADSGEETFQTEFMYSLKCYISEGVDHLTHGLLLENNEKFSPDRGAPFNESSIIEIPRYLTIHFSRLNWNIDSKQPRKVLQKVEYPAVFDIKEYCSDDLKEKLEATREAFQGSSNEGIDKDVMGSSRKTQQLTGIYDLVCVLTHEGESANLGHYIAWIKQEGEWIKCDDEEVQRCEEHEVLNLSGGGSGHAAYICMYKGQTSEIALTPNRN